MNILQSLTQIKTKHELTRLNKSLSQYGLQPEDWLISKDNSGVYIIENRQEPNFYFKGTTEYKNGRKSWRSIVLASL